MDFLEFKKKFAENIGNDVSERSLLLIMYRKLLDGTFYDILPKPFSSNSSSVQLQTPDKYGTFGETGLSSKRPSVRSRLIKKVVDDSVAFLFDEEHFPNIVIDDDDTNKIINDIVRESFLPSTMINLATTGSVGSGAILIKLFNGKFFYEVLFTEYLAPIFDPEDPFTLIKLTEKYKVKGADLEAKGILKVAKENRNRYYWYVREWTQNKEICYVPWLVDDREVYFDEWAPPPDAPNMYNDKFKQEDEIKRPKVDKARSKTHNLGIVPVIWIKNLPGTLYSSHMLDIDGAPTFKDAIEANMELDYQYSQIGRGLKYSAEPMMFIKNPSLLEMGEINKAEGQVLVGDENTDAKMLEINGDGLKAALDYCKVLREVVLENMHGTRASPDKIHAHQSGKAMEMLHQDLILLAGRLRLSYGEFGLRKVIQTMMHMVFAENGSVKVDGKWVRLKQKDNLAVKLKWPQWFAPSLQDGQAAINTAKIAKDSGLVSQESATQSISTFFAISDVPTELDKIKEEQQEFIQENKPQLKEVMSI